MDMNSIKTFFEENPMNIPETNHFSPAARTILTFAALFIIIIGLRQIASVVNTAFLAMVICITVSPLVSWFNRKGISKGLAVGITAILMVLFFVGVILLVLHSWEVLIRYIPTFRETSTSRFAEWEASLQARNVDIHSFTSLAGKFLGAGITVLTNTLARIGSLIAILAFAVLASIFMLSEETNFTRLLSNRFSSNTKTWANLIGFVNSTRNFLKAMTVIGIVQGVIIAFVLYLFKIPFPITWGLVFWLLNYIPYIGVWLALIPPVIIAGFDYGFQYALLVLLVIMVIRGVFNLFVFPKIMGQKVDTSMTFGFLGVFFWGATLGVFGVLLAYPYTILVRDVFLNSGTGDVWLVELMKSPKKDENRPIAERKDGQ
jgi:AI-2 transport protein TqsA